ncbi:MULTISPECIES: hypothetical protein [Cupriavidus]
MKKLLLLLGLCGALVQAAGAAEAVGELYRIRVPATPAFLPVKVSAAGESTAIELPPAFGGDLPLVFALDEQGHRTLLNARWDAAHARLIVPGRLAWMQLVLGAQVVEIERS